MTLSWRVKRAPGDEVPKFVVWDTPATGDKMAPFDAPEEHLDAVWFSMAWDYYKVAYHDTHSLTHQTVAGSSTTIGGVVMIGQTLAEDQVLVDYSDLGLTEAPRYRIVVDGEMIQNYEPVQVPDADRVRCVSFYATATELHCINFGTSSASALASTTIDYDVVLFRPPMDGYDPDLPVFSSADGILGQGIIRTTDVMLRRSDGVDDSPLDVLLDPAVDIDKASPKWWRADGTTVAFAAYAGSFSAPEAIQCALTE